MVKKNILIIEDDKVLAMALQTALSKEGYETEVSFDGEDGYEKILKKQPDLILLDILLPKLFGLELLARVRENKDKKISSLPAVVLTNFPEEEYLEKTEKLRADFLVKVNYSLADIVKIIKKIA